jgi:hypothetical protein
VLQQDLSDHRVCSLRLTDSCLDIRDLENEPKLTEISLADLSITNEVSLRIADGPDSCLVKGTSDARSS